MSNKNHFEIMEQIILEPTLINNKVMKEFYIPGNKDIKMLSFSSVNWEWLSEKIDDKSCGIYFLIDENSNTIYVGQSTDIISRLKTNYQNKVFTKALLFVGNDEWTETIISYLEHKFILEFKNNNIFDCINSKNEREPKHNSWEKQVVNRSLKIIKKLSIAENIIFSNNFSNNDFFDSNDKLYKNNINKNRELEDIKSEKFNDLQKNILVYHKDVQAYYNLSNNKICLKEGTKVFWNKFNYENYMNSKNDIIRYDKWFNENIKNIEKISNNEYLLKSDFYLSPSLAACLVSGYFSKNGKIFWTTKDNKSLNDLRNKTNDIDKYFYKDKNYLSDNNLDLTYSKPKYLKIFNEIIEIKFQIDIWKNIVNYLFKLNKEKMILLAENNWIVDRSIDITKFSNLLRECYEISKGKVYIETNLSGNSILKRTRKLLEEFDISLDEILLYF